MCLSSAQAYAVTNFKKTVVYGLTMSLLFLDLLAMIIQEVNLFSFFIILSTF